MKPFASSPEGPVMTTQIYRNFMPIVGYQFSPHPWKTGLRIRNALPPGRRSWGWGFGGS